MSTTGAPLRATRLALSGSWRSAETAFTSCAGGERCLDHAGAAAVDADRCTGRRKTLDRGDNALQLVPLPHRGSSGPRALAANVDDRRTRLEHRGGMSL